MFFLLFCHRKLYSSLTHNSGVNFDLNANIIGLAQQHYLLAQNALLLGQVLACHL